MIQNSARGGFYFVSQPAMTLQQALAGVWRESDRSSQARVAKRIGVYPSALSRWKQGDVPEGEQREKLFTWAEALPPEPVPASLDDVIARARLQTEANVIKLGEISGIARTVLTMMEAVTNQQRLVVNSLAPWVEAEDDLQQTIANVDLPLPPTPSAVPADARPAARRRKAAGE